MSDVFTDFDVYIFVVDTDSYAGNFERAMCAYMTGQVGDCEVGDDYAKLYREEEDPELFDELLYSLPDDHGCARPCFIWDNPNWFNNGAGGAFRHDDPDAEEKALAAYREHVTRDANKQIEAANNRRARPEEERCGWTDEAIDRDIAHQKKKIADAETKTRAYRCPSYRSVALFFDAQPTEEIIELLKSRARKFVETKAAGSRWKEYPNTIEGFRLLRRTVSYEDLALPVG